MNVSQIDREIARLEAEKKKLQTIKSPEEIVAQKVAQYKTDLCYFQGGWAKENGFLDERCLLYELNLQQKNTDDEFSGAILEQEKWKILQKTDISNMQKEIVGLENEIRIAYDTIKRLKGKKTKAQMRLKKDCPPLSIDIGDEIHRIIGCDTNPKMHPRVACVECTERLLKRSKQVVWQK